MWWELRAIVCFSFFLTFWLKKLEGVCCTFNTDAEGWNRLHPAVKMRTVFYESLRRNDHVSSGPPQSLSVFLWFWKPLRWWRLNFREAPHPSCWARHNLKKRKSGYMGPGAWNDCSQEGKSVKWNMNVTLLVIVALQECTIGFWNLVLSAATKAVKADIQCTKASENKRWRDI